MPTAWGYTLLWYGIAAIGIILIAIPLFQINLLLIRPYLAPIQYMQECYQSRHINFDTFSISAWWQNNWTLQTINGAIGEFHLYIITYHYIRLFCPLCENSGPKITQGFEKKTQVFRCKTQISGIKKLIY